MNNNSNRVVHKESLPAQSRLKRRRVDPDEVVAPQPPPATAASEVAKEGDSDVQPPVVAAPTTPSRPEKEDSNTSLSSSSDDEDDDDDIERENERLAQLRAKKGAASGSSGSKENKVSSYNHDVLFRRADWRRKESTENDKDKWRGVSNDTQNSATFKHFMKKHFK